APAHLHRQFGDHHGGLPRGPDRPGGGRTGGGGIPRIRQRRFQGRPAQRGGPPAGHQPPPGPLALLRRRGRGLGGTQRGGRPRHRYGPAEATRHHAGDLCLYPHLRAGTLRAEQGTVARCAGGAAQAAGRAPVGVPTRCQSAALVVSVAGAGESTARTVAVLPAAHRFGVLTCPLPPAWVVPAWVVPAWVVPAWVVP